MTIRVHPLAPVLALDIDGTLGDYHNWFIRFWNFIYMPDKHIFSPDWDAAQGEFEVALDTDKHTYRAAKLAYRMGGLKRSMPLFEVDREDGLQGEIQHIRSLGIQVWIATTRPWLSLTTVDPDTTYWLDHNVGKVDGLIYGEDKYLDLIDIVGLDRILGVVDDLPENIIRAQELGLRTALRRGPHNQWWLDEQLHRANSGNDYCNTQTFTEGKHITDIAKEWKKLHNV